MALCDWALHLSSVEGRGASPQGTTQTQYCFR